MAAPDRTTASDLNDAALPCNQIGRHPNPCPFRLFERNQRGGSSRRRPAWQSIGDTMLTRTSLMIALLFVPLGTLAQQVTSMEIGGRSVQMLLVSSRDLAPIKGAHAGFKLSQALTKIDPESNVLLQLRENGIAPD